MNFPYSLLIIRQFSWYTGGGSVKRHHLQVVQFNDGACKLLLTPVVLNPVVTIYLLTAIGFLDFKLSPCSVWCMFSSTPISTYARIRITNLPTNNQSSLPCYTEPKPSVIRIPSPKN
jgi:hypothetical protein